MSPSLLTTLAALMLSGNGPSADPVPVAPMPRVAKTTSIYKLRNAAAEYVAQSLNTHFQSVVAYSDASSNSLLVSAEPGLQQQIRKIVADLDKTPPRFVISVVIFQVKPGFAENTGIAAAKDGSPEDHWVLSDREVRMFGATIRQAKKDDCIDILSRPTLQVSENQNGFVQVGNGTAPITVGVTPRLMPDGRVLLRVGTQAGNTAAANANHITLTSSVADGGTLMLRNQAKGEAGEILYVLTVHVVK